MTHHASIVVWLQIMCGVPAVKVSACVQLMVLLLAACC